MLPIPVLDGGHIVLAIIESLRRKPVNIRVLEVVQTSCAVLIIGYMLYITFFDVQDLPFVRKRLDQLESQSPAKGTPAP
jgi:regulator of sigma E protease